MTHHPVSFCIATPDLYAMSTPETVVSPSAPLILLVDDEPKVLYKLSKPLRKGGFRVVTACDGRKALECAAAERPDFVLMDVMMPHMDGFEVLKILKRDPETASIPVGMLMAMPAVIADHKAISGRGEFFRSDEIEVVVIKPLLKEPAELVAALHAWFLKHPREA